MSSFYFYRKKSIQNHSPDSESVVLGLGPSPRTTNSSGCYSLYRVGQKTGLFLRVDNFATVTVRKASDMSKFSNFV